MYINTEPIVKLENSRNASGMIQKEYGQNPIGTVFNLISLLNTNRQKPKKFCLFLIPPVTTTLKNRFRLQAQPRLLFPVGLHVEAGLSISLRRN